MDHTRRGVVSIQTAKLRKAQTKEIQQENALRRGELIDCEELNALCAHLMVTIARIVDALDKRIPPIVIGQFDVNIARAKFRDEVNAVREAAADEFNALARMGDTR